MATPKRNTATDIRMQSSGLRHEEHAPGDHGRPVFEVVYAIRN